MRSLPSPHRLPQSLQPNRSALPVRTSSNFAHASTACTERSTRRSRCTPPISRCPPPPPMPGFPRPPPMRTGIDGRFRPIASSTSRWCAPERVRSAESVTQVRRSSTTRGWKYRPPSADRRVGRPQASYHGVFHGIRAAPSADRILRQFDSHSFFWLHALCLACERISFQPIRSTLS